MELRVEKITNQKPWPHISIRLLQHRPIDSCTVLMQWTSLKKARHHQQLPDVTSLKSYFRSQVIVTQVPQMLSLKLTGQIPFFETTFQKNIWMRRSLPNAISIGIIKYQGHHPQTTIMIRQSLTWGFRKTCTIVHHGISLQSNLKWETSWTSQL